ncbi:MAG: thioredoxin domain-containing protein [Fimbriimonadaceae bacterium]
MKKSSRLITFAALALIATSSFAQKLGVGDPAPPMTIAKWIKGSEVNKFDPKKTYVVEFWATWCGPCKDSIPHITELAKKFGKKVTFAGISIWENQKDKKFMDTVTKFVAEMGPKMAYNIGAEGGKREMARDWMEASGENGIPTAFVIHQGKVAWIGHPMDGLESTLETIVSGKFNFANAKSIRSKAVTEKQKQMEEMKQAMADNEKLTNQMKPFQEAMSAGDSAKALSILNGVLSETPRFEKYLWELKFNVLMDEDEKAIGPYFEMLSTGIFKDDFMNLNSMAWKIVDEELSWRKRDYALALKIATKADELAGHNEWAILDTLALAQFHNSMLDKAIENQAKAVKLCLADKAADEDSKKDLQDRLVKFKKAKGG